MTAQIAQNLAAPEHQDDQYKTLARDLETPRQLIENAFLDVGGRLSQSAQLLNRITAAFETLPADLDRPELIEATERLAGVGTRSQAISQAFADEQAGLLNLVGVVGKARNPIGGLQKSIKMIGIVSINARVVAAGVIEESDNFEVFTSDIATLADRATKAVEAFSQGYVELCRVVESAAQQQANFDNGHSDTLTGLAGRLEGGLAEVTRRRRESATGSVETGRVSRQIANRIGAAVMALQVGDATRQRVEHIESALTLISDLERTGSAAGITPPPETRPALVSTISDLQHSQLVEAIKCFDQEVTDAERALVELASDAGTVMARSRELYGQAGAGDRSALSALSAETRAAVAVLRDCEAERGKLDAVAAQVQQAVRHLSEQVETVREIEFSMRLVSLNAAVRCAQLGSRGRALSVIARQLRDLTEETVASAEAASTCLEEVFSLTETFSQAARGAGQIGQLEQEATASIALLEGVDRRLTEALAILDQDGGTAVRELNQAVHGLSDHSAISEAMADIQMRLAALVPQGADQPPASELYAVLRRFYTMEGERRIHDAMLGIEPPAAASAEAEGEQSAQEAEDDFLLF